MNTLIICLLALCFVSLKTLQNDLKCVRTFEGWSKETSASKTNLPTHTKCRRTAKVSQVAHLIILPINLPFFPFFSQSCVIQIDSICLSRKCIKNYQKRAPFISIVREIHENERKQKCWKQTVHAEVNLPERRSDQYLSFTFQRKHFFIIHLMLRFLPSTLAHKKQTTRQQKFLCPDH